LRRFQVLVSSASFQRGIFLRGGDLRNQIGIDLGEWFTGYVLSANVECSD
jgi:hypothetical protein